MRCCVYRDSYIHIETMFYEYSNVVASSSLIELIPGSLQSWDIVKHHVHISSAPASGIFSVHRVTGAHPLIDAPG